MTKLDDPKAVMKDNFIIMQSPTFTKKTPLLQYSANNLRLVFISSGDLPKIWIFTQLFPWKCYRIKIQILDNDHSIYTKITDTCEMQVHNQWQTTPDEIRMYMLLFHSLDKFDQGNFAIRHSVVKGRQVTQCSFLYSLR